MTGNIVNDTGVQPALRDRTALTTGALRSLHGMTELEALRATVGWQERTIVALLEYLTFTLQLNDEDRT